MIEPDPFEEIWVRSDDGPTLCALINGDRGWLMYLRAPEDPGFSSRNPDYDGPEDEMIEYRLDNGQVDEYPAAWALPVAVVRRAIEFFRQERRPPAFVSWHNDSGDGTTIDGPV